VRLEGVHHITAITGDAPRNVDFYTRVLGLRLVAKTVNQDDPSVYHLFYADEQGRPGAELTFFEYPGAIPGRAGAGMVHRIVSRVGSEEALTFWAQRLEAEGVAHERVGDGLRFADPEGLGHELAVRPDSDTPLGAEHPEIAAEVALQGFDGVRAYSAQPEYSGILLERLLGAAALGDDTWELRGEVRGGTIAYDEPPSEPGRQSAGTVHHVAWGTTVAEHPRWDDLLRDAGVPTSGSSTATTSTRSTSASPAACCSRSPTTGPASRSTATASRSWGRRSSSRRSSSPSANASRRSSLRCPIRAHFAARPARVRSPADRLLDRVSLLGRPAG
jgi:glyoxalase family protein